MMMKAAYLLLFVSGTAFAADDQSLLKCRTISDQMARLACYDALPAAAPVQAAPAAPVAHAAPAAYVAAAAPAAAVAARTAEQDFGLEAKKMKEPEPAPQAIESAIVGTVQGWGPRTQFKLANGQVWKVIDGSEATLTPMTNPKVKVVRNYFGTLFMEIEGTNHSPKVRRVQ
ncbi:MAG TPA: hypothetical protein VFT37_02540 [Telluria sp.]|nr:hypothetical protein [Telluria sp.]